MSVTRPRVFTIPPDADFSGELVDAIVSGHLPVPGGSPPDPLALSDWTVLVPTRRAARTIVSAFAGRASSGASLLPRVRPLGDAPEDDLNLATLSAGEAELELAPALPSLHRQFVLAQMIGDWLAQRPGSELEASLAGSAGQVLALAESLGGLIDRFETADVPLSAIRDLFADDLPLHREDMVAFLNILRKEFPRYLHDSGFAGTMQRRSDLIRHHARLLAAAPPRAPVIAAGSTGSIPATAELLKAIAHLPLGAVVLPGLDTSLDDESWDTLEPQHPQYGFKELLQHIELTRCDVELLPPSPRNRDNPARRWFLSEAMRPSATSEAWHTVMQRNRHQVAAALNGMSWLDAPDQETEAKAIALVMRQTLETPGKTATLITPDRQLARKVKAALQRWAIDIDDTAGEPAARTPAGAFLLILLDAALHKFKPGKLMALLDHPFSLFGLDRLALNKAAADLEAAALCGRLVPPSLAGLVRHVGMSRSENSDHRHRHARHMRDADWAAVADLGERLQTMLGLLEDVFASATPCPLSEFVETHLRTAEAVTAGTEGKHTPLWLGDSGETVAELFRQLREQAQHCPPLLPQDYAVLVRRLLMAAAVRPRRVLHPRLAIHGLLEARLLRSDVTILGGLNESVWPADAEIDAWLNRPQKRALGLDLPERRLGLMAHDFAQAAAAPLVYLCSSRKIGGQPAVASRWLLRMKVLLAVSGVPDALKPDEPWIGWAMTMDAAARHAPIAQPRPKPPVSARPNRLSVTRIDRLIKDPYSIFAQHILGLEVLEPLDAELGARERGNLVHRVLERFVCNTPGPVPADAVQRLMSEFDTLFAEMVDNPALAAFWRPQMQRIAEWFMARERQWRSDISMQLVEQKAVHTFSVAGGEFALSCIADRIDVRVDGSLRLIDYKTGTLPAARAGSQNYSVQLDLEAQMALAGAFAQVGQRTVSEAAYVRLSGGEPPGEVRDMSGTLAEQGPAAMNGLVRLLEDYADADQPYLPTGGATREDRAFDYDHLSRWREWRHVVPAADKT